MILRTKWICPNCTELSPTRHWSVERHIRRKHIGSGEPISINTHQTRTQMNIESGYNSSSSSNIRQVNHNPNNVNENNLRYDRNSRLKSSDNHGTPSQIFPKIVNNNSPRSATSKAYAEETRKESPSGPTTKRGIIDQETFDLLRQLVQLRNFFGQNQLGSSVNALGMSNTFMNSQFNSEAATLSRIHKDIYENNRNLGLRGRLCSKCCHYWIDFAHNNRDEGMKSLLLDKLPSHVCDEKKLLENSKYDSQVLANKRNELRNQLNTFLTVMISGFIFFGHKPIYLNVEKLRSSSTSSSQQQRLQRTHRMNCTSFVVRSVTDAQSRVDLASSMRTEPSNDLHNLESTLEIREEDCINLGALNERKKNHWAYRATRALTEGNKNSIIISEVELIDFVWTARATFGAFVVQMGDDEIPNYYFMYFSISN